MTYLQFHLVFTIPPLVALALLQRRRTQAPWWPLGLLVAIAFAYTTPWDNYLVAREVWTYPLDRVIARIGYVPVEEYAFFVIQTVLTGLWYRLLSARWAPAPEPTGRAPRVVGAMAFGALAALGLVLWVQDGRGLYMGLILAWACPVLAFMWGLGGHIIWSRRGLFAAAVIPPTLYLWAADWYAIRVGIWDITDATRTGWEFVGLPVEEAIFFLVTNLLVAQGMIMLEPNAQPHTIGRLSRRRAAA